MKYKTTQVFPYITNDEIKEVTGSLKAAWLTEGPKAKEFVEKILKITGAKYGVLMPNGTLALYAALMVLGIKEGDEVIVPDFTFIASANAVYLTGAKPVFVDVRRTDFNLDPDLIERYITKKTKAIMPVHIYGQSAEMTPIMKIASKYKLKIVEDAAQGLRVFYKKRHVGTFGDLGCISFFADKTITTGEGGIIITNSKRLYDNLLYFRNQGRLSSGTFKHPHIGYNFRMNDLLCGIGLAQLRKLDELIKRKLENQQLYEKYLQGVKEIKFIGKSPNSTYVPFRSNILCRNLTGLIEFLEKNGIQTRSFFYPLHKQPCYKFYKLKDKDFPNSIYGYKHGLSLPVYHRLTRDDIKYICDKIKEFYQAQQ